ncbi:MAG: ABC transporter permease [Solirubrobacteraceae bacterium]
MNGHPEVDDPPHAESADVPSREVPATRAGGLLRWARANWIFAVLIAIIAAFSIDSPYFLTKANWITTSTTATEVLLLAIGETFVIVSGGIDLSVGAALGLSGMTGGWTMMHFFSSPATPAAIVIAIGFIVTILTGLLIGLLNGLLVSHLNIPSFVVTLGTLGICTGLGDLIYGGQEISTLPPALASIGNTNLGSWVPVVVLVAVVLAVVFGLVLAKTRFGNYTYAIGDSCEAASRAGVNHRRHLVKVYMLAGVMAGVAGVTVMVRLGVASPTSGSSDNLNAIAAAVIGGTSLFGGRGTIAGAVIGTAIISVLLTGLIIVNVPPFWQLVAVGIVLIAAVYVDQLGTQLRTRGRRSLW